MSPKYKIYKFIKSLCKRTYILYNVVCDFVEFCENALDILKERNVLDHRLQKALCVSFAEKNTD